MGTAKSCASNLDTSELTPDGVRRAVTNLKFSSRTETGVHLKYALKLGDLRTISSPRVVVARARAAQSPAENCRLSLSSPQEGKIQGVIAAIQTSLRAAPRLEYLQPDRLTDEADNSADADRG